jgi:hypothetical protein
MQYSERGGVGSWAAIVVSGALVNWLVGLAFFFAAMAQTVLGKYLPLAFAVILFEVANLQHSLANMGYFSLIMPTGNGPGWADGIWWNIVPAAIGNILGGAFLFAVPFWYGQVGRCGKWILAGTRADCPELRWRVTPENPLPLALLNEHASGGQLHKCRRHRRPLRPDELRQHLVGHR